MEGRLRIGFVLAAVTLGAACEYSPYPRLKDCASARSTQKPIVLEIEWKVATIAKLAWADGKIYATSNKGVLAVSQYGGTPTVLVPDEPEATEIWVQGDKLLYAVEDRLMEIPRAGGTATTLVDGALLKTQEDEGALTGGGHIYDGTYFYWANRHPDSSLMHIWRAPLAGGAREGYPAMHYFSEMVLVADGVLGGTYGYGGDAQVAPFGKSSGRSMDKSWDMKILLSMDSNGALWAAPYQHGVELSPADGSAWRMFSTKVPAAYWGYSDGKGGHFFACREQFDDEQEHDSIWFVAPNGGTERLACLPGDNVSLEHTAALAPDALYVVQKESYGSLILKISRGVND